MNATDRKVLEVDARHLRVLFHLDTDAKERARFVRYARWGLPRQIWKVLLLPFAMVAFAVGGALVSVVVIKEWVTDDRYDCRKIRLATRALPAPSHEEK